MMQEPIIEKVQLAEVDPAKKYLIMVKVGDGFVGEDSYYRQMAETVMDAMVRLGCPRANVSIFFGADVEIASVVTEERERSSPFVYIKDGLVTQEPVGQLIWPSQIAKERPADAR